VVREHSSGRLLGALIRAYFSGILGLGPVLRKRREILSNRKITNSEFLRLMRRYRISARDLAIRD
jgi:hypothetical protein